MNWQSVGFIVMRTFLMGMLVTAPTGNVFAQINDVAVEPESFLRDVGPEESRHLFDDGAISLTLMEGFLSKDTRMEVAVSSELSTTYPENYSRFDPIEQAQLVGKRVVVDLPTDSIDFDSDAVMFLGYDTAHLEYDESLEHWIELRITVVEGSSIEIEWADYGMPLRDHQAIHTTLFRPPFDSVPISAKFLKNTFRGDVPERLVLSAQLVTYGVSITTKPSTFEDANVIYRYAQEGQLNTEVIQRLGPEGGTIRLQNGSAVGVQPGALTSEVNVRFGVEDNPSDFYPFPLENYWPGDTDLITQIGDAVSLNLPIEAINFNQRVAFAFILSTPYATPNCLEKNESCGVEIRIKLDDGTFAYYLDHFRNPDRGFFIPGATLKALQVYLSSEVEIQLKPIGWSGL